MYRVRQEDLPLVGSSHQFVGADNGDAAVSVFLFNGKPGSGPGPDATVLTVAVANAIQRDLDYAAALRLWGRQYPDAGYGGMFVDWLRGDDPQPYNSFGNGSAMRVSAVAWAGLLRRDAESHSARAVRAPR